MTVAVASDHAGLDLKQALVAFIRDEHLADVQDLGTHDQSSCDYPDYAVAVARAVASGGADLGILVCGTGVGMSVAANKVSGISAALCADCFTARLAREHNAANVLCLGARVTGPGLAQEIVRTFLLTPIDQNPRHARRRSLVAGIQAAPELE